jgi:hypothetical protein
MLKTGFRRADAARTCRADAAPEGVCPAMWKNRFALRNGLIVLLTAVALLVILGLIARGIG